MWNITFENGLWKPMKTYYCQVSKYTVEETTEGFDN